MMAGLGFLFEDQGKPTNLPKSGNSPNLLPFSSPFSLLRVKQTPNGDGRLCQSRTSWFWEDGIWVFFLNFDRVASNFYVWWIWILILIWIWMHRCKHYRRRCRIRAPCCNEIYSCRHCHNEATVFIIFLLFSPQRFYLLPFNLYGFVLYFSPFIRACWRTTLITTNSFAKMLNKYDKWTIMLFIFPLSLFIWIYPNILM